MKIFTLPKLICLLLFLNFVSKSHSQDFTSIKITLSASPASQLNCSTDIGLSGCNYIQNDQFTNSATNITNPFASGQVSSWVETHGSPALTNFFTPPGSPPTGIAAYTSMYSWNAGYGIEGEGIAQKISPLTEGNVYAMSFFKKISGAGLEKMGRFYIVLLHCEDYQSIHTYPSYSIPAIPQNSQVIYCENGVVNTEWQQMLNCFRALDDDDLVWVFPIQDENTSTFTGLSGIDFSGLEIINTTNFSAGAMPVPTYNTPVVNVGPASPNCSLRNAVFTWTGPNGQTAIADANQKTTVDASDSLQIGEWTLRMTAPSGKALNNPCKQLCNISNTVDVPMPRKPWPTTMQCDRPIPATCNLIQNNGFQFSCANTPQMWDSPFYLNCVNGWDYAFSSPQLNGLISPLNVNNYTATMWSLSTFGVYEDAKGEGITTSIPKLIPGHKYSFTFYKAAVPHPGNTTPVLDEFNAYLIKCTDYEQMEANLGIAIPPVPTGAQRIYCETNLNNPTLQRVSITFTATSDYNILWIFPRQWTWAAQQWWAGIAQPELIDVTGFTAGPNPTTSLPNCSVSIGPLTPNCGPTGAVYTWYPPNGGSPIVAGPTQRITINTSVTANIGVWTLRMTVPNTVMTNNSCSDNTQNIQATVTVTKCGEIWPKVYYEYTDHAVQPTGDVVSDNFGNVFLGLQTEDMSYNVNHNGALVSATPGRYCIQYNKTTGITTWTAPARRVGIALNSGDLQLILTDYPDPITTRFVNGTTGASVTGPLIPANEIIIAEDNGIIITRTTATNGSLYVHNGSFTSAPVPYEGTPNMYAWSFFQKSIYDPINNRLYVEYVTSNPPPLSASRLAVYSLANNTLTLINSPMSTILNGSLAQINTNGEIFLVNNNGTYKYNYLNDTYILYGTHGINYLCNKYPEDRILYTVDSENKIYYKNTVTQEVKKIPYVSPVHPFATGIFDGNTFYMQGGYEAGQIGSQIIPAPTPNNFFTKLSIQSDFSFRQTTTEENAGNFVIDSLNNKSVNTFNISLLPNPAKDLLQINIDHENNKIKNASFSILITNSKGVTEIRKNVRQQIIKVDISHLKAGLYFITVTNSEGVKTTKTFLKN